MTQARSSVYRGETREIAEAAYHADARVMLKMGFAPASEDWSSVLEEVLTVQYVYAPELGSAVRNALAEAEAEAEARVAKPRRSLVPWALRSAAQRAASVYEKWTPDQKISFGAIGGMAAGILLWWFLASSLLGDQPLLLFFSLFALGLAGLLVGATGASRST